MDTTLLALAEQAWQFGYKYFVTEEDALSGVHPERTHSIAATCNGCELIPVIVMMTEFDVAQLAQLAAYSSRYVARVLLHMTVLKSTSTELFI
jgi:hypothetical protein